MVANLKAEREREGDTEGGEENKKKSDQNKEPVSTKGTCIQIQKTFQKAERKG